MTCIGHRHSFCAIGGRQSPQRQDFYHSGKVEQFEGNEQNQTVDQEVGGSSTGLKRYFLLACGGLRNRTPSPPVPLSSMSSMPAFSKACRIAASLASVTGISPSTTSTRRIVATPTLDAAAKSRAAEVLATNRDG